MTILQNAYKGYLTNKYEKEINEFKELALSVINNAESKLKEDLYNANVIINNPSYSERVTKELLNLIDVKRAVKNNPLEIEGRLFNHRYIDQLVDDYQKLNNLILKGEAVTIDENKYKWDLSNDGAVKDIIDKQLEEAKKIIKSEIDNEYVINVTVFGNDISASKLSTEIMKKIKKDKGGHI